MRNTACRVFLCLLTTTALAPGAISVGLINDFQDGTTQGWSDGTPMTAPPVNQLNVGPAGAGDHSLAATVGASFDTFSIVNSSSQWTGNYSAAGITTITLDINNLGPNSFNLGILLNGGSAGTNSVSVPAGSGWITRSIDVTTLLFGSPSNLSSVSSIELVSLTGGSVVSVGALDVQIDNIRTVPEPSAGILGLIALSAVLRRRR